MIITSVVVFVLAGIGSIIRLKLASWQGRMPWGILTANVVASFIAGYSLNHFADETLATSLVVGLAGGLSTFSSWAAANVNYLQQGKKWTALGYALLTLALSSTAALLGVRLL